MRRISSVLVFVGIVFAESNERRGPYWRDVKYGREGLSYHGLKYGGVYTDEDFKFSEESPNLALSARHNDDTRESHIGSSRSELINELPLFVSAKSANGINLTFDGAIYHNAQKEEFMPRLSFESHIIAPPSLHTEQPIIIDENKQEVIYANEVTSKLDNKYRGDECIDCTTKPLYVNDVTDDDDLHNTSKSIFDSSDSVDDLLHTIKSTYNVTEDQSNDSQHTSKPNSYATETHDDAMTEAGVDDAQYTTKPTFITESHVDESQYTTKPTYVTEPHVDNSQYTTKPTYVTEPHVDDSQYTIKPTYVTETHVDDSQYTTKPTYVTELHVDDSQYTTKPTYVTEPHVDDSQYTTKPTYVMETHVDNSQYTTKPTYVTEPHVDDSQYTTKSTYVTEPHVDDSQYTTKPTYVTETHVDDSKYTTEPTYVTEPHVDDSQYTAKPTYVTETHVDDSEYTTKPTYVTEPHVDDSQYTTKPTYVTEPHVDDFQYTTKPTYVTETHVDDSQYTTKPTYVTEPQNNDSQYTTEATYVTESHVDDSQYTTKPTHITETHVDDSQYTTKPTYVTEVRDEDSQYTTKPSYVTETHVDDSQYTTKPTHITETHVNDSQYTTKPTYVTEVHDEDSQYTTKPSYVTETHVDDSQYTTEHIFPSKTPFLPVNSVYKEWDHPTVFVNGNPQGPFYSVSEKFDNRSDYQGFEYIINHGHGQSHQRNHFHIGTAKYPSFDHVTTPQLTVQETHTVFTTESSVVKGKKIHNPELSIETADHTTNYPQMHWRTELGVKGGELLTTVEQHLHTEPITSYPNFKEYNQPKKQPEVHETETTSSGYTTNSRPIHTTDIPVKGYHPSTIHTETNTYQEHVTTTTDSSIKGQQPQYNPSTLEYEYKTEIPTSTMYEIQTHPLTNHTFGEDNHPTGRPHIYTTVLPNYDTTISTFTSKSESGVKGEHRLTSPIFVLTTKAYNHDTKTPKEVFYQPTESDVKGYTTVLDYITTEIPKVYITNEPITPTTKVYGIKGGRNNFFVTSSTEQSSKKKIKDVKGHRRHFFVTSDVQNDSVPLPKQKKEIKGYENSAFELGDKNIRLHVGRHFYFPTHNTVKRETSQEKNTEPISHSSNSTNENIKRDSFNNNRFQNHDQSESYKNFKDVNTVKGIKTPFKYTETVDREFQENIKGHVNHDTNRSEIKGRSGEAWKKYFFVDFLRPHWKR